MIRIIPRYNNHLWYPILVKLGGGYKIVEMQGKTANDWNDSIQGHRYLKGSV
jgi:hypothetical protein